jgi:hypothetical protein
VSLEDVAASAAAPAAGTRKKWSEMTHNELLDRAQDRVSDEPLVAEVYVQAAQLKMTEALSWRLDTLNSNLNDINVNTASAAAAAAARPARP